MGLKTKREVLGLSQIALSQQAGISRTRLQLAEAGQLSLRDDEVQAIEQALRVRAALLRSILDSIGGGAAA